MFLLAETWGDIGVGVSLRLNWLYVPQSEREQQRQTGFSYFAVVLQRWRKYHWWHRTGAYPLYMCYWPWRPHLSLLHVSTQTSAHAAAVFDLQLLSNQGQKPVPGCRGEETGSTVTAGSQTRHIDVPGDCRGQTATLMKHQHPAPTASDELGGKRGG